MNRPYDMRTILLASVATLLALQASADSIKVCYDKAKTQSDTIVCAGSELDVADKDLNSVYQEILRNYKDDKKFLDNIKAAQQAWLKWRDAEIKAIYPEGYDPVVYGSSIRSCWNQQVAVLTRDRTKQLRKWIEEGEEGDVCSGSMPIKE